MILDAVLRGFEKRGVRSIAGLAESAGIDEVTAKEAVGRLEALGYLSGAAIRGPARGAQGARKGSCAGCSGSCAARAERLSMWELSENGKRYLRERKAAQKEGNDV